MRSHFIKIKEKRKKKPLRSFEFVNSFTLQMSRSPNCLLTVVVLKPIKERAFEFYTMIWLVCDLKLYNCLRNAHFSSTNFLMISAGLPKKKFSYAQYGIDDFEKAKHNLSYTFKQSIFVYAFCFFFNLFTAISYSDWIEEILSFSICKSSIACVRNEYRWFGVD